MEICIEEYGTTIVMGVLWSGIIGIFWMLLQQVASGQIIV